MHAVRGVCFLLRACSSLSSPYPPRACRHPLTGLALLRATPQCVFFPMPTHSCCSYMGISHPLERA